MRNESLVQYLFDTIDEVQDLATQWLCNYNHERPNMASGGFNPTMRLAMAAQFLDLQAVKNGGITTAALLHREDSMEFADAGCPGAVKREDLQSFVVEVEIAARRSTVKQIDPKRRLRAVLDTPEHAKASIWVKVEHPFHVVKNLFRDRKGRLKDW